MTKHKVAELDGPKLDAAVAMAEGIQPYNYNNKWCLIVDEQEDETVAYEPSSDWELAGPIIERERIALKPISGDEWEARVTRGDGELIRIGSGLANPPSKPEEYGPTALIAGMRAYVASKFGEEIELP